MPRVACRQYSENWHRLEEGQLLFVMDKRPSTIVATLNYGNSKLAHTRDLALRCRRREREEFKNNYVQRREDYVPYLLENLAPW